MRGPTPDDRTPRGDPQEGAEDPADVRAAGLFGDVIFRYTREQALADGVLVDVSGPAKEAGFRLPVALTRAA